MKMGIIAICLIATGLTAQDTETADKKPCKTAAYNTERPSLSGLDLTTQEKKEITALAKRGRKVTDWRTASMTTKSLPKPCILLKRSFMEGVRSSVR